MWSNRFLLLFYSHHSLNYKINVINNLVDRGVTLAHKNFYKEKIQKIKLTLLKNNSPPEDFNSVKKKRLNFQSSRDPKANTHTYYTEYLRAAQPHTYMQHTCA